MFYLITEELIRTGWRSLKDTLQRHQRLECEARSGSGTAPKRPYAFARYLDFRKPVLELRNTEASWEEEEEEGEEHAAIVDVDEGVSFACTNIKDSSSMEVEGDAIEVHESSTQEQDNGDTDISTPSNRRQRQTSTSRRKRSSRAAEQVEDQDETNKLLNIVSGITEQINVQRCPHTMFALSLVPLLKDVLPDHYFNMRIAVQHCIHSFTMPRHVSEPTHESTSTQITPISSASKPAPNPYPSSFSDPSSIYETPRSRSPYPIPPPIASLMTPPTRSPDMTRAMELRPRNSIPHHFPQQSRVPQLYIHAIHAKPLSTCVNTHRTAQTNHYKSLSI
ncbi:hypothetical protein AB205_0088150 [Aquarana catesbeiana]|uniref:MADF domain-containing protein n=1 Tax=Aquarana catesbeiana TaxID=8400 RepID=A0A2G9QIG3_AQUCT|nr:hypothetical protein AB205_0088150 [Aquarana catesbeiana]